MRGESASLTTYSETSDITFLLRKRYAYHQEDKSKLTFLIHGPENSSHECKVLGYFGSRYYKSRPNKVRRKETATKKEFIRHQENNAIFKHAVDDITLHENKILSLEYEAHENIDSEVNENYLYEIYDMSLDENK